MDCQMCGRVQLMLSDVVTLLTPQSKVRQTIACKPCARMSDVFCVEHDMPHNGFSRVAHACFDCADEFVSSQLKHTSEMVHRVKKALSTAEWIDLLEAAKADSRVTYIDDPDISIMRFLAARALHAGLSIAGVVKHVELDKSLQFVINLDDYFILFPETYYDVI